MTGALQRPALRVEYAVTLELPGGVRRYRVRAWDVEDLGDLIAREVRAVHPDRHVDARVADPDGTVHVRVGWGPWQQTGTWKRVS